MAMTIRAVFPVPLRATRLLLHQSTSTTNSSLAGPSYTLNSARIIRQASSNSSSTPASTSKFGLRAPAPDAHPLSYRDGAIPYKQVQLVDPSTNALLDAQSLRSVLESYDNSTHTLVLVNVDREVPIVKLVDKLAERVKEREAEDKARLKRRIAMEEKEVQISWQSAKGDLDHKLGLAQNLLEKGDRVQVVFANRKRGEAVSDTKKDEIIANFDDVLGQVGNKWKVDEKTKSTWTLFFNPLESTREEVTKKVVGNEIAKRREKEDKKEEKLEARRKKEERRKAEADRREEERLRLEEERRELEEKERLRKLSKRGPAQSKQR